MHWVLQVNRAILTPWLGSKAFSTALLLFGSGKVQHANRPCVCLRNVLLGRAVRPTIKPGWNINVEKQGTGEEAVVKSISWSGGSVGAGFRDDFSFSAKAPETATELRWNAYQTYDDGLVVSWNVEEGEQPKKADGSPDFSTSGPFSVTKVVSSLSTSATSDATATTNSSSNSSNQATITAVAALIISLIALALSTKKTNKK